MNMTKNNNRMPEERTAGQSKKRINWREVLKTFLSCVVLPAVLVLFLFNYVFMLSLVPSGSMENTLMSGVLVFATRFDRTDIQRYDIMIFIPPDQPDVFYIKRVIGLPGETVTIENGQVYAGTELLDDSFLPEPMLQTGGGVYQVPEGCYFMLGDNRNYSLDARYWNEKYVPAENMVSKAQFILFPFSRIGSLHYEAADAAPAGFLF